jgi:hypothetical protein
MIQTRKEELQRKIDLLYFIYQTKLITIDQAQRVGFFKTYLAAQKYIYRLVTAEMLSPIERNLTEKNVYTLDIKGLVFLREKLSLIKQGELIEDQFKGMYKNIKLRKVSFNRASIQHDLKVNDILIYFKKHKAITDYITDYFLRRVMSLRGQRYAIPDLEVKEPGGRAIMEFENTPKKTKALKDDIRDYKAYYKNRKVYFIIKSPRVDFYKAICERENLKHYSIGIFENHIYTEKVKKFNP